MRILHTTRKFNRGDKKMRKRGCNPEKIDVVVEILVRDGRLPTKYHPHILGGELRGLWECHIEHDWLLVYKVDESSVTLYATGTHDDLFS